LTTSAWMFVAIRCKKNYSKDSLAILVSLCEKIGCGTESTLAMAMAMLVARLLLGGVGGAAFFG
jgi:hypothetical protein